MSNRPAKNRDNKDSLDFVLEQRSVFSGPLPPPETLKGYGTIDPQYPERIFKLAEEYTRAEIKGKDTESRALILGMILSFLVSLAGLFMPFSRAKRHDCGVYNRRRNGLLSNFSKRHI